VRTFSTLYAQIQQKYCNYLLLYILVGQVLKRIKVLLVTSVIALMCAVKLLASILVLHSSAFYTVLLCIFYVVLMF